MTAVYPDDIFAQRDIENVTGVDYDATKKTRIYAEDLVALAQEISAIETILGENVNGSYDTVFAWLTALAAGGGGVSLTVLDATGTIDDSNTAFLFTEKPTLIYVNGIALRESYGWSWSVLTATLSFPVGSGGVIFAVK